MCCTLNTRLVFIFCTTLIIPFRKILYQKPDFFSVRLNLHQESSLRLSLFLSEKVCWWIEGRLEGTFRGRQKKVILYINFMFWKLNWTQEFSHIFISWAMSINRWHARHYIDLWLFSKIQEFLHLFLFSEQLHFFRFCIFPLFAQSISLPCINHELRTILSHNT